MGNNIQIYLTNLFEYDSIITVTSGETTKDAVLDNNNKTFWASVSSNDTVTERLTLTLAYAISMDTIFMAGNNFKTGLVEYYDGSWNTAKTITSNKENYKIDLGSVITGITAIRFSCTTTETANEEKRCAMFIGTALNFEFTNDGRVVKINPMIIAAESITEDFRGLQRKGKRGNGVFAVDLTWRNLGVSVADFNNLDELAITRASFILNLVGDDEKEYRPWTYGDIKKMSIATPSIASPLSAGIYTAGVNYKVKMVEMV